MPRFSLRTLMIAMTLGGPAGLGIYWAWMEQAPVILAWTCAFTLFYATVLLVWP